MVQAKDLRLLHEREERRADFLVMLRSAEAEADRLGDIPVADVLAEIDRIIGDDSIADTGPSF